jgi:hypothetical protein
LPDAFMMRKYCRKMRTFTSAMDALAIYDPEEGSNEVYTSLFDLTPKLRRERD